MYRTLRLSFLIIWPLGIISGMLAGYATLSDEENAANVIIELSSATLTENSVVLHVPHTDPSSAEFTTVYADLLPRSSSSDQAAIQTKQKLFSSDIGAGLGPVTLASGISTFLNISTGKAFDNTADNPEPAGVIIPTFLAAGVSACGYIPGYYVSMRCAWGLDEMPLYEEAFIEQVRDTLYRRLTFQLSKHLLSHPDEVLNATDIAVLRKYGTSGPHTERDRAQIHPLLFSYLSTSKTFSMAQPHAEALWRGCVIIAIAAFLLWIFCLVEAITNEKLTRSRSFHTASAWIRNKLREKDDE